MTSKKKEEGYSFALSKENNKNMEEVLNTRGKNVHIRFWGGFF